MKKLVYICSPFRGDYDKNTDNAIAYSSAAFRLGYIPVTPHIYFPRFMSDGNAKERSMAMAAGLQLLAACSEVWVFGLDHPSEGMQAEIAEAIRRGIPIIDGDEILSGKKKPEDRYVLKIDLHKFYGLGKHETLALLAKEKLPIPEMSRDEMECIAAALNIPLHVLLDRDDQETATGATRRDKE